MANLDKTRLYQWLDASSHDNDCSGFDLSPESGFTASLYQVCLLQLSRLVDSLASSPKTRSKLSLNEIRGKLVVFGDGFEDGKLDSCINSDSELRGIVLGILYDIGKALTQDDVVAQLRKSKTFSDLPKEDFTQSLKQHLDRANVILEREPSESESVDSDSSEGDDQTSVFPTAAYFQTKHLDSLAANVNLLMDMCPALEQTYRQKNHIGQARLLQAQRQISVATVAHTYCNIIRDRFPLAERSLVEHLGEANWARHVRLRSIQSEQTSLEPALSFPPKSLLHSDPMTKDSALGSSLPINSQKAPSISSHSSLVSTNEAGDKGHFRVPELPKGTHYGETFLCPFCKKQISRINTRVDWKMHVFADLQPYTCTFKECLETINTFQNREAWVGHERTHHLSQRSVQRRLCTEKFDDNDGFILHAGKDHDIPTSSSSIRSAILSTSATVVLNQADYLKCPLCHQENLSSYRNYTTHVGRHFEEIALCALPLNNDQDDKSDDEEDSSENSDISQDEDLYDKISLIAQTKTGGRSFTAIMDTGADCNIISMQQLEVLGFPWTVKPDENEVILTQPGGGRVYPLGTVFLPMRLRCEYVWRAWQFHVVEDHVLGKQGAILGAKMTMQLGHLQRKSCRCCDDIRGQHADKDTKGDRTGIKSGDQ